MNMGLAEKFRDEAQLDAPALSGPLYLAFAMHNNRACYLLPSSDNYPAHPLNADDLMLLEQMAKGKPATRSQLAPGQQRLLDALNLRAMIKAQPKPVTPIAGEPSLKASSDLQKNREIGLVRPFVLRLDSRGYSYLNHDGNPLLILSGRELAATTRFGRPTNYKEAFAAQKELLQGRALNRWVFGSLAKKLAGAGLLRDAREVFEQQDRAKTEFLNVQRIAQQRAAVVQKSLDELDKLEAAREAETGQKRIKVVPVQKEAQPLLSHGLIMSYAQSYDDGRLSDHYRFMPDWCNLTIPGLTGDEAPMVFLFSNYIWSHTANMTLSRKAREMSPHSLCVHGGPDTPKYPGDIENYLTLNTHIDIIVHGEGEATFAEVLSVMANSLSRGEKDMSALKDVQGITYRDGDDLVTTADRPQIRDLDSIPSPYSNGMFDNIGDLPIILQTIETNRGCPFGCTFCDWGSATNSKIRKYELERVFADLEWCAKNRVKVVFNTDANFGVFERDVDVAKKVVELKEKYGYPKVFESSYAKNRVNHLKKIIEILADGGVVSTGTLSLQSVDPETLEAIKRSNIKVSKYDELAVEFGKIKLPLIVEMMMGLPGSTLQSFQGDLQQAIDREVHARVNPTEVLVNSPMNEPAYREEYDIHLQRPVEEDWSAEENQQRPDKALIISTSTFTQDEYRKMEEMRQLFLLMENYGVLRQVARYVRHETGHSEMHFYMQLLEATQKDPQRWPTVTFTLNSMKDLMVQPCSWKLFIDEVRDFLVSVIGITDDYALDTVITVQHALLPARDRQFPLHLQLPHDYPRWHASMVQSKAAGWQQDWRNEVKPLREFDPGSFSINDSQKLGTMGMGTPMLMDIDLDWEFESPIGRALRFRRSAELA